MSIDNINISLERYFYPAQIVRARPEYDKNGDKNNNATHINRSIECLPGEGNRFALQIDIENDLENSVNPPYEFQLTVVGLFNIIDGSFSDEEKKQQVLNTGTELLIGALRERIAMLTHSAPWGVFNINVLDIPKVTALSLDPDSSKRHKTKATKFKKRAVKLKRATHKKI